MRVVIYANKRDWSLITGRGGYKTLSFTPMKREMEKVVAMMKGGHKKFWGSFYAVARSFSHIEGGGVQKVSTV